VKICPLCDKPFEQPIGSKIKTYCSTRCARRYASITSSYGAGRPNTAKYFPSAQVKKILLSPVTGVSYD
jgi:hypothetical protein